jgi:MFS family permease
MRRLHALTSGNRDLLVATLTLSATTFTVGAMQTVLPLYAASLGATVQEWGLIAAMWGVAMAVGEPFWGRFHDRVDRVRPLIFRAVSSTAIFLVLVFVPVAWPLYLLNLWRGFTDAAPWPASRSLASRAVSAGRTAWAMAVLWTGARLGSALGAFSSGQVAAALGDRYALLLSAFVSLAAIAFVVPRFGWSQPAGTGQVAASGGAVAGSVAQVTAGRGLALTRYRPLVVLGIITILSSVGWGALTFLPFLVTESLGGTVADVGLVFTVSSLATMALMIPMGSAGDRMGKKRMVVVGLAVYALATGGIGFAASYLQVIALMILGGAGQAASRPSIEALVSASSRPEERGSVMGVYGTCEDVGAIVGPALGSLVWGIGGPSATYLLFGCLIGAGSIVALFGLHGRGAAHSTAGMP